MLTPWTRPPNRKGEARDARRLKAVFIVKNEKALGKKKLARPFIYGVNKELYIESHQRSERSSRNE